MGRPERRKDPRLSPANARVWLVSGEFEELYTTVNFARRLVNIGPRGACVETGGRLRSDVKLCLEVRFDDVQAALRTEVRAVWSDTVGKEGQEVHRIGLSFTGRPEIPTPVRELLSGVPAAEIMARRSRGLEDLKRKSEERKRAPARRRSPALLALLLLLLLVAAYAGSFAALVSRGRIDAPGPELRYRYRADMADFLKRFYGPAHAVGRAAGVPLLYAD